MEPDIIIEYRASENSFSENDAYAVIYVRPETNEVRYERAILAGVQKFGKVAYLANLNGDLILRSGMLEDHYASQFRFATSPVTEMAKCPEIVRAFEAHFGVPFDNAPILGSFHAASKLKLSEEELFGTHVPACDFLSCFGQTFKKIAGVFVVNYDLPAIVTRYKPSSNVFVVLVRAQNAASTFFTDLNLAIYAEVVSRQETPVIDADKLTSLVWSEQIRRTYHISTNHLMAMFDMSDFVYKNESERLHIVETPLGSRLLQRGVLAAGDLEAIKQRQLARIGRSEPADFVYLPTGCNGKSVAQIEEMIVSCR